MSAHPGKTPAQRRVLDQIGCGNHSPYMAKATRERLLRDGLIVELPPLKVPFIGAICMDVRQFEMPIPVHMQWCNAMSDETPPPSDPSLSQGGCGVSEVREKLIQAGVRNLKEFGYPGVTADNILTDYVYAPFFKSMLEDNRGKGADTEIDELLAEIEAGQ